jgi:hypothetical protein
LRIKQQETRLILHEQDDDDDELQFLPQNKHIIYFTKTNQLMLYREIIPTTSECRKEKQLHFAGKVQSFLAV